jgi:hypothetical protein
MKRKGMKANQLNTVKLHIKSSAFSLSDNEFESLLSNFFKTDFTVWRSLRCTTEQKTQQ